MLVEHLLKLHVPAGPETELLDFLLRIYATQNAKLSGGSQASLDDCITQVNNLQRYFDELHAEVQQPSRKLLLSDVSDALLAGAMKWQLKRGLSPSTANKLRASIRAFVSFARNVLEMQIRPLKFGKFPVPKRKPQCWLPDEVLKLLTASRDMPGMVGRVPAGRWFLALNLFVLNTGTRISAAMATPTEGLDLNGGWITIPADVQKHDADEVLDLLPVTCEALAALEPTRNKLIFGDWPFDRKCRQWPTLNRWQKRLIVAAGLRPSVDLVTKRDLFHKLRRSFATFVAAKGGPQLSQELLGHSHQSVTKLYIDTRLMGRRRVGDLLGDMLTTKPVDRQRQLFD